MFEYWIKSDLMMLPNIVRNDTLFQNDANANKIGVIVTKAGSPVSLSGAVKASIIKADGSTVYVDGSVSGNQAYVILPATAYDVVGSLRICIKIVSGGQTTTLGVLETWVFQSRTREVM